jgi:hypothetical protein
MDNLDERIGSEREREIARTVAEPDTEEEELDQEEEDKSTETLQRLRDHFLQ